MKFTNGFWLVRDGYTVSAAAQGYDARDDHGTLEVYAPTRPINHRGDTLGGVALTYRVSAPAPDVLRVRVSHWQGGLPPRPEFELSTPGAPAMVTVGEKSATITSGRLTAKFPQGKAPWLVEFWADDRLLTSSEPKGAAFVQGPEKKTYMKDELSLDVGELVYGLGERFGPFVKNGQAIDIWNEDGGTASEQAYKNVPFYLTNRGYGVFVNHPDRVAFEVGSEKLARVQFSVEGEFLEYFILYGPTPKEILTKYTALTGRPTLPPPWSLGLWLTTSFTTSYDEATVTSFIDGMAQRDLPLAVFHFDCFWMREFHWTDFLWDQRTFPDPRGMLARIKAKGLKVCVWINPYIAQRSVLFEEGRAQGFLVKRPDGGVWQTDLWQPGMALVDFTHPGARAWFAAKLAALVDLGVDAFKTDFGERIPTDVVWADGSAPARMHNYYPQAYNQTVFEVLEAKKGRGEAVVFARSATAGGQKYPVHWGGDCASTFPAMAESLRGGLSLGLSGFGFWSHDIGGFEGTPPEALFHRWLAFGLLSSHSRLHGSSSVRVPWVYGDEAVEVTRFFTKLKLELLPSLYARSVEACRTGVPVMRAALLEFPDDLVCQTLDRQYFLGPDLLVAPVFRADGRVDVYVPEGTWTHLLSGATVTGPRWVTEVHGPLSLPLYARPHSLVVTNPGATATHWGANLVVKAFELEEGRPASTPVVGPNGADWGTLTVTRRGEGYEVEAPAALVPFTLVVGDRRLEVTKAAQRV